MRNFLIPLLLAGTLAAQTKDPPAADPDHQALVREFEAARKEHNEKLVAASRAKDTEQLERLRAKSPAAAFAPRFAAKAQEHAGEPQAVPFLTWLTSHAPAADGATALATLMERHLEDPGIRLAVARIGTLSAKAGLEKSRQWLADVIAKNPDAGVVLQARFTRSTMHVGTRASARSEELRQQAIADLRQVLDGDQSSLRGLAKGLLHEAENLEPGLPAPDIEGEDLDGVKFKLSDYRGKVVLLDFWGDW
jgi:hypothetical protein